MANVKWDDPAKFPIVIPAAGDYVMGIDAGFTQNQKSLAANWILSASLAAGVQAFLVTPTSANLATAVTDETGTGPLVFGNGPTITLANGTGLPISTGVAGLAAGIATWMATPTSVNLLAAMTTKTGTGNLVFAAAPAFTSITLTGSATGGTSYQATAAGFIGFATRGGFGTNADGTIFLRNIAGTDFSILQWGGSTNSFPAIKKNSATVLSARAADDSADIDFQAARLISTNVVRLKGYTVATLPAGTQGDTAFVTDATAPAWNVALTGGGAVVCKAFYNGTAWVPG